MRSRILRIVAFSFGLAFILTLAAYQILGYTLSALVNQQLAGKATWEELALTPGTLTLRNVRIVDDAGRDAVTTPEIRIRYDAASLFGKPVAAIQEVVVERPMVEIFIRQDGTSNLASIYRPPATTVEEDELPFKGLVLIKNGEVAYRDPRGDGYAALFVEVDGRIDMQEAQRATGHLYFKEAQASYKLDAAWRRTLRDMRLSISVDRFDLGSWLGYLMRSYPGLLPPVARGTLHRGTAWANVLVSMDGPIAAWRHTWSMIGSLRLDGVDGVLDEYRAPIRNGSGLASFTSDLIHLERMAGRVGNVDVRVHGRIFDFAAPQLDLTVHAASERVEETLQELGIDLAFPLRGRGDVTLVLDGSAQVPRYTVHLRSPRMVVGPKTLENLSGVARLQGDVWRVERASALTAGGPVSASGWILTKPVPRAMLRVRTQDVSIRGLLGGTSGLTGIATVDVTLLGTMDDPLAVGSGHFRDLTLSEIYLPSAFSGFLYGGDTVLLRGLDAATSYGQVHVPAGFVDIAGEPRFYLPLQVRGATLTAGGAEVRNGNLDGVLFGTPARTLGWAAMSGGTVIAGGNRLDNVHGMLAFSPDLAVLPSASFDWRGNRMRAGGTVAFDQGTVFDLSFASEDFDPRTALASAPRTGPGRLQATIVGSMDSAIVEGHLRTARGNASLLATGDLAAMRLDGGATLHGFDARLLSDLGLKTLDPSGRLDAGVLFSTAPGGTSFHLGGTSTHLSAGGLRFDSVSASGLMTATHVRLDDAFLSGPGGMLAASGRVPLTSGAWDLHWRADRLDLGRLAARYPALASRLPDFEGLAKATGTVTGPPGAPVAMGEIEVEQALLGGEPVTAQMAFRMRRDFLSVLRSEVRLDQGRLGVTGTVGLRNPAPLDLRLEIEGVTFDDLRKMVAMPGIDAAGRLHGDLAIGGTTSAPTVAGDVRLEDGRLLGQSLDEARASLRATRNGFILRQLTMRGPGLDVQGQGRVGPGGQLSLSLSGRGLDLQRVPVPGLEGMPVRGDVDLVVRGTTSRPEATFSLDLAALGPLAVRGRASWAAPRLLLEDFTMASPGGGTLTTTGTITLASMPLSFADLLAGRADISSRAQAFDLSALTSMAPGTRLPSGLLDADVRLRGPLSAPAITADAALRKGAMGGFPFERVGGRIEGDEGLYRLTDWTLEVDGHEARVSGTFPFRFVRGEPTFPAPMRLEMAYQADDLGLLSALVPGMQDSPAMVGMTAVIEGRYPDIRWTGDVQVANGTLRHQQLARPVEDLQIHLRAADGRLLVQQLTGRLGEGTFAAEGGADILGTSLANIDIRLRGEKLAVETRPYLSSVMDADLRLTGGLPAPGARLEGSVVAREATVSVPLRGTGGASTDEEATDTGTQRESPRLAMPVDVLVKLDLGDDSKVRLLSSTLEARGTLTVGGRLPEVAPRGVVTLAPGVFQLPFFPVPLRLVDGTATFDGASMMPELNATAMAHVSGYDVYIDIKGTPSDLDLAFSSNPPLSQQAIQGMLLLGRVPRPGEQAVMGYEAGPTAMRVVENVATAALLTPVTSLLGGALLSEVTFELIQTGGVQLRLAQALDRNQKFFLTYATLQGTNTSSLPDESYGFEYRIDPTSLVRVSTTDRGQTVLWYQARWRF